MGIFRGWWGGNHPKHVDAPASASDESCESMTRLVVGLGNPGRKYLETRHNVGFRVIEAVVRKTLAGQPKTKFKGELYEARINQNRLLMLCPQTFMNRSGSSVQATRDFYRVPDQDILVICDDFQLPLGALRIRPKGSSGGQKGLDDVLRCLGTQQIPRLRVGIGQPPTGWDVADFVLSKFGKDDVETIQSAISRAAQAVEVWVNNGIESCMNEFNRNTLE